MSSALAVAAVAAVAGTAYSVYNGQQQAALQEKAMSQQKKAASDALKLQDEANNKANRKTADTASILSQAQQSGKGGISSTMLTGAGGIDPSALALQKNTLLGS